jgi:hypothetical protein
VWRALLVYVLLGYAVYFMARFAPQAPGWATELIEALKPWMGALKTAERVSNQAFQVQMLTIYTFFASMPLVVYAGYLHVSDEKILVAYVNHNRDRKTSRLALIVSSLFFLMATSGYYLMFTFGDHPPSWRDVMRFSPGFLSATFSLVLVLMALLGSFGLALLKTALFTSLINTIPLEKP